MFSGYFSIHKRKDLSKNFNEDYIFTKKLFLNNSKKYRLAMCLANRGGERVTGPKKSGDRATVKPLLTHTPWWTPEAMDYWRL